MSKAAAIKPIETHYNGYRFRSRLEARWAVFFDTLGIHYEYEPEGYDLSSVGHADKMLAPEDMWYLPDFFLPNLGCYVEIKPLDVPDVIALTKCSVLANNGEHEVLIVMGMPGPDYRVVSARTGHELPSPFWKHKYIDVAYRAAREARF